jgi:cytochrome c
MRRSTIALVLLAASWTAFSTAANAEQPATRGADLFTAHNCVTCHGAEGKAPISKLVPELAGKPADELYDNALKILSGSGASEESKLMHAAIYSASNCSAPPTDEEVKTITDWLATR